METITLQIPDPVFRDFQEFAKSTDRQPEEVIREAMEIYRSEKMQSQRTTTKTHSLLDHKPISVGEILKPLITREDIVGDMYDDRG